VTPHAPEASVQLDDVLRAASPVQAVDVLRDDGGARLLRLHVRDDLVARVRIALRDRLAAHVVEVPDPRSVAIERALAGVVLVVVLRPHAALASVRGNSTLDGQAGAGEKDDALEVGEPRDGVGHDRVSLTLITSRGGGRPPCVVSASAATASRST